MFGTDYPMWGADDELERFRKLPLTAEERRTYCVETRCGFLEKVIDKPPATVYNNFRHYA